jgi:release factor glutamine methyltransferase
MTIQHAYQEFHRQLQQVYDTREAENITRLAIEHVTGLRKIDVVIQKTKALHKDHEEQLRKCLGELLLQKPIQYVLNEAWFAGLKFYVNENVLIPRPETEELVEWTTEQVRSMKYEVRASRSGMSVLDIGTGSGCIAITLKKRFPAIQVTGIDISVEALEVARKNAAVFVTDVDFLQLDFLNTTQRERLPKFDIIISNPPYIPLKDQMTMSSNVVGYEPHIALFVENEDPVLFFRHIADFAREHLNPSGEILTEIHEDLGKKVCELFQDSYFSSVELRKDMQGKDRMLKIVRGES